MTEKIDKITPAFQENNIAIVLAASNEYAPYMAVTIQSVIDSSNNQYNYDFILLHSKITKETQHAIETMKENHINVSIRFIEIEGQLSKYNYNFREGYSPESFYRIIMIDILSSYDKVLYLDCDTIAMSDVAELFQTDLENYLIAATRDIDGISNWYFDHDNRRSYISDVMGLSSPEDYFQSGVVLFNLKMMRKTFTLDEIIQVTCSPKIIWGDQDALNILCNGYVKYLDLEWNVVVNYGGTQINDLYVYGPPQLFQEYLLARSNAKIIHYAGTKPWVNINADMFQHFWRVARETPFYEVIFLRLMENSKKIPKLTCQKQHVSNVRRLADIYFPKGTRRREILKKIIPKGSRRWNFLKKIFRFVIH